MKKGKKKLTAMQKLFCDCYLIDPKKHGTNAAIDAGYSVKTATVKASKLLTKVNIQEYINKRKEKIEEFVEENQITIARKLVEIMDRCMQKVPVMVFDKVTKQMVQETDEKTGEGLWTFDANGAKGSINELNKMMGYHSATKIEADVTVEQVTGVTVL